MHTSVRAPGKAIDRQSRAKASCSEQAVRWWYVVRYYRASQLTMRLVRLVQRRLTRPGARSRDVSLSRVVPRPRGDSGLASLARRKLAERALGDHALSARDLAQGRYRFLNVERTLPDPIDWRLDGWPDTAHLWRFHLHYHEFLLDLAADASEQGEGAGFDRAWEIVRQWIETNRANDPRAAIDAWHPYCISRRLPVWICLWLVSPPGGERSGPVLRSTFSQARYLERHLEWDVRGNHLLENAKALALAGAFLDGPDADRWLEKAARILRKELAEQILAHGEHFERSPMYHALMLEAVLDVREAVGGLMPELARLCGETAERMAAFLREIVHPDGEIPLLGDSVFGETAPIGRLVERAGERGRREPVNGGHRQRSFGEPGGKDRVTRSVTSTARSVTRTAEGVTSAARVVGDYWVYRHADDFLLFDAGPVGPDHLPAHAHADLLTFEASIRGRRLFVDSGVFSYQDEPMRRYGRSSRAHNVLQIDGSDQCDTWSRFRMGYRGWPSGLVAGEEAGFHWACACHNAYRRLGVPRVGRWMACRPGGPWLCVDWGEGRGRRDLSARLHLHPDVSAEKVGEDRVRLQVGRTVLDLRYLTAGRVTVSAGWYSPRLGHRLRCPVVRWSASAALPAVCAWSLAWGGCRGQASIERSDRDVVVRWTEGVRSLRIRLPQAARTPLVVRD